jgi:hypothetical protein
MKLLGIKRRGQQVAQRHGSTRDVWGKGVYLCGRKLVEARQSLTRLRLSFGIYYSHPLLGRYRGRCRLHLATSLRFCIFFPSSNRAPFPPPTDSPKARASLSLHINQSLRTW